MLSKGEAGSWDEAGVGSPVVGGVLKDGGQGVRGVWGRGGLGKVYLAAVAPTR